LTPKETLSLVDAAFKNQYRLGTFGSQWWLSRRFTKEKIRYKYLLLGAYVCLSLGAIGRVPTPPGASAR
jgi:hypothetical protein